MNASEKIELSQAMSEDVMTRYSPIIMQMDKLAVNWVCFDREYLEAVREMLDKRIRVKRSASVLYSAIGKDPDTTDEEYILKTLEALEAFMDIRVEYMNKMGDKRVTDGIKAELSRLLP